MSWTVGERIAMREALVAREFSDDGKLLRGLVSWKKTNGDIGHTAIIIILGELFPFEPPAVFLDPNDQGFAAVAPSFHIDPGGALCLYGREIMFDESSWGSADNLLKRISRWLEETDANWSDDDDCDLERYLPNSDIFVVYDGSKLEEFHSSVAIKESQGVVRLLPSRRALPYLDSRVRAHHRPRAAWIADLGVVAKPITGWDDLKLALGAQAQLIERHVLNGLLELFLLRYQRGSGIGVLVVQAKSSRSGIAISACESADESLDTRKLRGRIDAESLSGETVAVVGCGAIGSAVAEILFRSGVQQLTLIDPDRLRPGNVIRHVASIENVGMRKVHALLERLRQIGLPTEGVITIADAVNTPGKALNLFKTYSLVIDLTADSRTTHLLASASEESGSRFISGCLQREGGIARVDRWPLTRSESHMESIPYMKVVGARERGCGDFVSLTPPSNVVAAASLTVQVVLDQLGNRGLFPPTLFEVLRVQEDEPFRTLGRLFTRTEKGSAA